MAKITKKGIDPNKVPELSLYRTRWTGDPSTIIGQLQGVNDKLNSQNDLLQKIHLLNTMIADNTNCTCEGIKELVELLQK